MSEKTPQQQAEEVYNECRHGDLSLYGSLVSELTNLIQAKKEHDQLRLEKLVANECSVWAGKENMNPAEAIRSLESERDQLKQQLDKSNVAIRLSGTTILNLQFANAELEKDKERFEWGIQFPVTFMNISCSSGGMSDKELKQARKAIDSAMKGSK